MIAAAMVMSTVNLPVDTFANDFSDGVEISVEDENAEDTPDVTVDGDEEETDVFSDEEKENIEDVDISDQTENEILEEPEDEQVFSDHTDEEIESITDNEILAVGTTQAEAIVNVARGEIGISGQPNKYTKWYGKINGTYSYAWCHAFVAWCAAQAGVADKIPKTASCQVGVTWFKNKGQWKARSSGYIPSIGDLIYFDYKSSGESHHVGIVTGSSNGRVYTIEGNASNAVKVNGGYSNGYSINDSKIMGYGVPNYSSDPTPTPTPSHVDVGTNFYAYLINTATWLHATNDDSGNVSVRKLQYTSNQTWYFERQGDGSYKITSCKDGRCMEVHNFESANGTNVEMNGWNGNTAQRWFIYGSSGEYKLKAACGNNALDMRGGPDEATDGTNLNMWEDNGTAAQKFQIWKLEPNLGTTAASVEKYGDADGNNVKISWNSCNNATGYDIRIFNESETEVVQTFWNVQGTSCLAKLASGTYRVRVYTLNSQFNAWKEGETRSFTCSNNLGKGFYAYLINTATWLHATNDGGNVNVKKLDYSPNQIWYFELQSDGSYKITSAEDDRCMEVHNFESANGTNVEMNGWNGNTAQRWFIYGSSGAYKLKAACGENALDMKGGPEAATDGTNLNMWEDNGTDAQKFSIWKLDDIKDTIRNKTIELEYSECVYTGKECTPEISVKKDSTELVKDTDYRVSYENNVKVGTATVTILGIGKYTGRIKKQFKINKASQNLTVSVDKTDLAIGETAQIKASGQEQITYKSSAEDKVTVSSTGVLTGKQAGDATITITASGTENYNSAAKELLIHVLKDCVGNKHTWDSGKITKQPTCTEDGKKTYTCTTCGTVRTEILPATGHTWDNGKITREATCITDGQKTYTCTICKNTKTESISKTGHKEVKDVAVSATCESAGKTEGSHCSICGTIIKKQETIPATGHTWDSGKVTKQPTCTTDGQKTYTCTICKKTKTENISKTGHKEVKDAAVSATCENTGKTEGSHCSVCNTVLKKQETLPATGHTWDGGKVTKAATCTTDGEKNYTCTTCHKTRTESIPKTGHTEVKDAATPATCENTGKTEGSHCSVCNTVLKKQETLPALGHTWDSGKVTKVATCTTDGEKNYTCTTCHKTRIESVPKTGHTEVKDAATPATCEDAGKTEGSHCSICGTVIKKQETIPALGHTWDSGKVTKAATCTTDGEKTYTCTTCQKTRTETIPATGHTEITKFAKKATCETEGYTGDIYCNNCGKMLKEGKVIEKLSHDWKQTGTKKATCTASGENTYTCIRCNKTKTEQIPATGHKWSTWWKLSDATVFKPQKQQRTCSLCHISQTRDYGSKLKSVIRTSCSSLLLKTKQTTNVLTVSGMAKGDYVSRVISGNTGIVRVTRYTKDGKIQLTAQSRTGNTSITIQLAGGAVKRINVKVQSGTVKTTAIRVSFTKATLKAGTKKTISTTVTPSTSQEKVTYTTSNKNIATVTANGIITARKRGTAKITVKSGSKKQIITVIVK